MATTLDFYQRAQRLGHSVDALQAGQSITSTISVPHIDALKTVLGGDVVDPASRAQRIKDLFGDKVVNSPDDDASEIGILDRVQRFIFGNDPLSDFDRTVTQHLFPFEILTASYPDKTITGKWDLTSPQPVIQNIGKLTMEPGSYIVIHNTALTFYADTIVRNGNSGLQGIYDFNILGATGTKGGTGSAGSGGGKGSTGTNGTCSSPGIAGSAGKKGETGSKGATGGSGGYGGQGLPSLAATITINTAISGTTNQVSIMTRSGTGGAGGVGGAGGSGGQGGQGGKGATCGCEGTNGGNGGLGGNGGRGGTGGNGGNGVDANANVVVTIPASEAAKIITFKFPAPAGPGATGGNGGATGSGGSGGHKGKHQDSGSKGGEGTPGNQGPRGTDGTVQGQPAQIIVNKV